MNTVEHDIGGAFQEMRRNLLGYLRRSVSDTALAEDLLQDVFVKALVAGKAGTQPRHLSGWLYGIANNAIVDHYRSRRPAEALPDDIVREEEAPERVPPELSACLLPLTRALPAIYRDTLIATEFEGHTLLDLSREWNVSLSAVKSRASRGRRMLKDLLMRRCELAVSGAGDIEYTAGGTRGCVPGRC